VGVLGRWKQSWPARPEVVVDLPAAGHAALVRSIADHVSEVGGLSRASLTVGVPVRNGRSLGSADEAVHWRDTFAQQDLAADVAGRPVLLLVDATSSLWPITVASAFLRRAGASVVLPLLVHRQP